MPVDIGPRIGIDGEKEFRQQLQNINQQLRTLGSEMKAVTSAFDDGDQSEKALTAQTGVLNKQIDAQKQKLSQLQRGLDEATQKFGEADTRTLRWAQAVNDATADLNRMENQLGDLNKELNGGFFDKLKAQIKDLAGDSVLGRLMDGGGLAGILGKGFAVGSVVTGVQHLTSAMFDLVESTQEYRSVMASLEVSSQAAGYTAEETADTYQRLQSVLGDTQTAATATANLQAIGLSQEQLMTVTDAAIGAWARYGDSIPIDGLAESINETIRAGTVTGTFADVLNWGSQEGERFGVTLKENTEANKEWNEAVNSAVSAEDFFNLALEDANSEAERANIVLQALADQGLARAGQAWIENNKDLTETNAATEKLNAAWARLGETLAPLAAGIKSQGADALNFLLDQVDKGIAFFSDLPERALTWGKDLIDSFVEGIKSKIRAVTDAVSDVAGEVADFLGFSEPERGPLSDFHTFAPDMMDLYSRGIRDNAYKVTAAVDSLADRMQAGLPSPTVETVRRAAADTVNGISAINSGVQFPREIVLTLENGQEIARWLLPYSRAAARANPEVGTA